MLKLKEIELPIVEYEGFIIYKKQKQSITPFQDLLNIPSKLKFKLGAKVMCKINIFEEKLFNGSIGVITELCDNSITVTFEEQIYTFERHSFGIQHDSKSYTYKQFPLVLSWAITVHVSQGSTITCAYISPTSFAPGQFLYSYFSGIII